MIDIDRDITNIRRRVWSCRDGILILSLLFIALLFVIIQKTRPLHSGRVCQILYNREVVMTMTLDDNRIFSIEQMPQVVFEVRDNRIAFVHSDCLDQICVHTGFIGEVGQFAACLPNRLALRIIGEGDEYTPDTIS